MASDGVAHDARDSGGRKTRLIFMIKVKVKVIFGSHAAQARAGNYASARAHFDIPPESGVGDSVARGDDTKLGETIEPGKFGKMFCGFESLDFCRIMKTQPRGIHLSDGGDARTAGA